MKPLRQYQENLLMQRFDFKHLNQNVCIQLPTGTGKTNVLAYEVAEHVRDNQRVLVLAPKQETVNNIAATIPQYATIAYSGVLPLLTRPVLVTTPESAKKYIKAFKPTWLISDEVHHCASNVWGQIAHDLKVPHTGYTATPNRLDGKGLYPWFKYLLQGNSIKWFIEQGYLSDFDLITSKAPLVESSLDDALSTQEGLFIPRIKDTVKLWIDEAYGLKTLIFCATIKHADLLCDEFVSQGINAAVIHSENSQHRQTYLNQFKAGLIDVLINVQFFTEGVDIPDLECVILSRFTYSTALFLQMCGRLLRPLPGITRKKLIDLAGNCYYHGSPDTPFHWSLEGQSFRTISNQQSIQYRCINQACQQVLAAKKQVIENVCVSCLKCQTENFLEVPVELLKEKKGSKIHQYFSVDELHHIEDRTVTELTRIIFSSDRKWQSKEKKITAIMALNLPVENKKKALKCVGCTEKDLFILFDD